MPTMTDEQRAEFDRMGLTNVLNYLKEPTLPENQRQAVYTWLSDYERRREASQAEQASLAREASEAASRAASAAERAASATERQAIAAERANTRATIALVLATISIIATVAVNVEWSSIFILH
jgi:hypothetical protein